MQIAERIRSGAAVRLGALITYAPGEPPQRNNHESVTRMLAACKLADLLGYEYWGEYDAAADYGQPVFVLPNRTIVGTAAARALGIRHERDLFGGVVPHEVVATKSITHPLVDADAQAPQGWSPEFAESVRDVVLKGYSAFNVRDAKRAGRRLLDAGPVRVKPAGAIGGRGQSVAATACEIDAAIDAIPARELAQSGVVFEENLTAVKTYSVGKVIVGELVATYFGTQKLVADHDGIEVYGGSDLLVVGGGFEALLGIRLPESARTAIEQARAYDAAAGRCFDGFIASRRNYDVAAGASRNGAFRSGVLEQSWRIGGASGAEIGALEYFRSHPEARAVRAATFETYGDAAPPDGATIYFDGIDEKVGRILKYTVVEPYVDT